ncbi:hypothetical protein ACFVZ2_38710, partial [Streptomyces lasiicapitis]
LVGFAITGLGLANIFPVAVERAGALAGPSGVATASTLGYGGMLLGPPAIGFMADWFSLPVALTSVAVLAAVAAGIGAATGRVSSAVRPTEERSAEERPSVDDESGRASATEAGSATRTC